jgi:hypothetical protein
MTSYRGKEGKYVEGDASNKNQHVHIFHQFVRPILYDILTLKAECPFQGILK